MKKIIIESLILTANYRSKVKPQRRCIFDVRGLSPDYEIFDRSHQITIFNQQKKGNFTHRLKAFPEATLSSFKFFTDFATTPDPAN